MTAIDTLPKALIDIATRQPDLVAMRKKEYGVWHDIPWSEYLEKVKYVALGMHALGLKRGDKAAIIGENRPEWLFCAMGIMSAGAVFAGIYTTNPVAECEYVVGHSEASFYLCEDEEQLDKALAFRDRTPLLRKMIVWEMRGLKHFHDPMVMSFDELLVLGKKTAAEQPNLFGELVDRGRSEDIAGIIYTSGTTGPPKGATRAFPSCL
jgi:long-chain acyl-CoA synthetase